MSKSKYLCYAYQVEIRENQESDWMHLNIMVSLPGHAARQVGDSIKKGSEDLARVKRISDSRVFLDRVKAGYEVATQEGQDLSMIEFNDAVVEPKL